MLPPVPAAEGAAAVAVDSRVPNNSIGFCPKLAVRRNAPPPPPVSRGGDPDNAALLEAVVPDDINNMLVLLVLLVPELLEVAVVFPGPARLPRRDCFDSGDGGARNPASPYPSTWYKPAPTPAPESSDGTP